MIVFLIIAAALIESPYSGISHKINQDFVRYFLQPDKEAEIPREYIPGGKHRDRKYRLTDWSYLSMAGTVDALLRHRHASMAFGTREIKHYHVNSPTGLATHVLASSPDWREDAFIHDLFSVYGSGGEAWTKESSRDYSVTNRLITITNWVGYVTNVVTTSAGIPQVTISNRYQTADVEIVDTQRIKSRWLESLNAVRYSSPHSIYNMLAGDYDPQRDWPRHNTFSTTNNIRFGEQFIGWGSTTSNNVFGLSLPWGLDVVAKDEINSVWRRYFRTASEHFYNTGLSRRVADRMNDMTRWLLGYDQVCDEQWSNWHAEIDSSPAGPSNAPPEGVTTICQIAGIPPPSYTNAYKAVPDYKVKGNRIIYEDWALANAFWAAYDTALIDAEAMPRLYYQHEMTNLSIYASWPEIPLPPCELRWDDNDNVYRAYLSVSLSPSDVGDPEETVVRPGTAEMLYSPYHSAGARFSPSDAVATDALLTPNVAEAYRKNNSLKLTYDEIQECVNWFAAVGAPEGFNVGDRFVIRFDYIDYEYNGQRDCLVLLYCPETYYVHAAARWDLSRIPAYFASLNISAFRTLDFYRTTEATDYNYHNLERTGTNSIPMIYPNPTYQSDEVKSIDAQAIMVVAKSTNDYYKIDGFWGDTKDDYAIAFETYSYKTPLEVDSWWRDLDRNNLRRKVRSMAQAATRVNFDVAPGDALIASMDAIKNGSDVLSASLTNIAINLTFVSPIAYIEITSIDRHGADWQGMDTATFAAYDYNGNKVDVKDGVWLYMDITSKAEALYLPSGVRSGGANGSISGLGAVHWDFKAMRREDN